MKDLLKTVETFLTYSEAKLEELSEKNQQLKIVDKILFKAWKVI